VAHSYKLSKNDNLLLNQPFIRKTALFSHHSVALGNTYTRTYVKNETADS